MSDLQSDSQATLEHVTLEKVGRCGLITLNRPKALNALSHTMLEEIDSSYHTWINDPDIYGIVLQSTNERAFCAGADIRLLYDWLKAGEMQKVTDFFRLEYQHNWNLELFNKPNVPLIDGIVMGGGVGISIYGTHCVMGKDTQFAMPEVSIGLYPDIGASYVLSRMPHNIGFYLGLTGRSISAPDCLFLHIASHTISKENFPKIRDAMIESDPIDPVLDNLQEDFGESEIEHLSRVIEETFCGDSVEDILANLDEVANMPDKPQAEWAKETAGLIRSKAPFGLKIAFRTIQLAESFNSLKDALEVDFRIISRLAAKPDLMEGVRAMLVEKDQAPQWSPESLADVTDEMVEACFEPLGDNELNLDDIVSAM